MTEDEMIGWNHRLDGHKFEQAPGAGMEREARRAAVHGAAKSQTRLNNLTKLTLSLPSGFKCYPRLSSLAHCM